MENPIVSRLLSSHSKLEFINESKKVLTEADEDEENKDSGADDDFAALNDDQPNDIKNGGIEDDSTAPEQGVPDEEPEPDSPTPTSSPVVHRSSNSPSMSSSEGDEDEPIEEPEPEPEDKSSDYSNPLDNPYAVRFNMGSDVAMSHADGSLSDRNGVVQGYDPEGFYRVKWSDGTITNGITDIALAELIVAPKQESKCICGNGELLTEGDYVICDKCGRRIRESEGEPQILEDIPTLGKKRLIRPDLHPVSTAVKPNISESIRSALKTRNSLKESDYAELKKAFDNQYWSRLDDIKKDITDLGYELEEVTKDYIIISSEDSEYVYRVPIIGNARSLTLDFNKSAIL